MPAFAIPAADAEAIAAYVISLRPAGRASRLQRGDAAGADQSSEKLLRAIDPRTGKIAWEIGDIGGTILGSGLMATAGGLVFYGDGRGTFVAADGATGKLLWHFNTGGTFRGGPMTYLSGGEQYVVTVAGSTVIAFGI